MVSDSTAKSLSEADVLAHAPNVYLLFYTLHAPAPPPLHYDSPAESPKATATPVAPAVELPSRNRARWEQLQRQQTNVLKRLKELDRRLSQVEPPEFLADLAAADLKTKPPDVQKTIETVRELEMMIAMAARKRFVAKEQQEASVTSDTPASTPQPATPSPSTKPKLPVSTSPTTLSPPRPSSASGFGVPRGSALNRLIQAMALHPRGRFAGAEEAVRSEQQLNGFLETVASRWNAEALDDKIFAATAKFVEADDVAVKKEALAEIERRTLEAKERELEAEKAAGEQRRLQYEVLFL